MKTLILISLFPFSVFAQEAVQQGTPAYAPSGFLKIETIYSNRDLDAETVGAIKTRMNSDASMFEINKKVTVSSRDNVIYLTGEVDSNLEMYKAVDHAKSISPANRIVNQITIKEPPQPVVAATPVPTPPVIVPPAPATPVAAPEQEEAPVIISN